MSSFYPLFVIFLLWTSHFCAVQSAVMLNQTLVPRDRFGHAKMVIEGDILIRKRPITDCHNKDLEPINQTESHLWPNGVIPIEIDPALAPHTCIIKTAMLHIMTKSCIYFRQREPHDRYYVKIFKGNGCYATIGRNADFPEARLSLGSNCYKFGIIVHELMHVIGFHHEHRRTDRDQYLQINYDNIQPIEVHNFAKNEPCREHAFTPFDLDSIMLFSSRAFSKDGKSETLQSKVPNKVVHSNHSAFGLSKLDADSIVLAYKCTTIPIEQHHMCEKFLKLFFHMKQCPIEAKAFLDLSLVKLFQTHVDVNHSCLHYVNSLTN